MAVRPRPGARPGRRRRRAPPRPARRPGRCSAIARSTALAKPGRAGRHRPHQVDGRGRPRRAPAPGCAAAGTRPSRSASRAGGSMRSTSRPAASAMIASSVPSVAQRAVGQLGGERGVPAESPVSRSSRGSTRLAYASSRCTAATASYAACRAGSTRRAGPAAAGRRRPAWPRAGRAGGVDVLDRRLARSTSERSRDVPSSETARLDAGRRAPSRVGRHRLLARPPAPRPARTGSVAVPTSTRPSPPAARPGAQRRTVAAPASPGRA